MRDGMCTCSGFCSKLQDHCSNSGWFLYLSETPLTLWSESELQNREYNIRRVRRNESIREKQQKIPSLTSITFERRR
jgi:hypothetical protein